MIEPSARRIPIPTGLTLSVLEWGQELQGQRPSVILVHGFLDMAWGFAPLVAQGLGDRHILAVDMRGHGDSDRVGAGGYYHFMDYVADLAGLVAVLGSAQVALVGHSMGGSIAAYYAGAFPERVERLALLEGLGPPEDETAPPVRARHWVQAWQRIAAGEGRRYASVDAAAARLRHADPLLSDELSLFFAERGTNALPSGERSFKHDPLHVTRGPYPFRMDSAQAFWRAITCPVLLMDGAESPFRSLENLEERVACLPGAESVTINDASHMLQRHQPEAVARALRAFLG
ncbi:MAG: alpha/beta hydrolase [Myxococcales bacterium]|nr:alpha/beta hydrolase [Myxococcales bacterium]